MLVIVILKEVISVLNRAFFVNAPVLLDGFGAAQGKAGAVRSIFNGLFAKILEYEC